MNLIETLEKEEIARLSEGKTFPKMNPGDTVVVNVNVVEGSRKRVQAFEGVIKLVRQAAGILFPAQEHGTHHRRQG